MARGTETLCFARRQAPPVMMCQGPSCCYTYSCRRYQAKCFQICFELKRQDGQMTGTFFIVGILLQWPLCIRINVFEPFYHQRWSEEMPFSWDLATDSNSCRKWATFWYRRYAAVFCSLPSILRNVEGLDGRLGRSIMTSDAEIFLARTTHKWVFFCKRLVDSCIWRVVRYTFEFGRLLETIFCQSFVASVGITETYLVCDLGLFSLFSCHSDNHSLYKLGIISYVRMGKGLTGGYMMTRFWVKFT